MITEHEKPGIEDKFVKVYSLTKLTGEEKTSFTEALIPDEQDLEWVKPEFVPWTGEADGGLSDIRRIFKEVQESQSGEPIFLFFVDRQGLSDKSIIVVDQDYYTLLYSDYVAEEIKELAKEHGFTMPFFHEGVADSLEDSLMRRALTYGRIPAHGFASTWCNLDIGNMPSFELIELYNGTVEMLRNPEWDGKAFVRELEEEFKRRKAEGEEL